MIQLKRIVLGSAALAILAGPLPCAHAQVASAERPPDITEFVNRRASCSDWSQKAIDIFSANSPERATEIEAIYDSLRSLKCFDIVDNERALRQKYAGNPAVLAALGPGNYTKVITRLPVRVAVPAASDR
jgi:hypothetical protein